MSTLNTIGIPKCMLTFPADCKYMVAASFKAIHHKKHAPIKLCRLDCDCKFKVFITYERKWPLEKEKEK